MATQQILVFGRDVALTETRLLILQTSGFEARGVYSLAELVHSLCNSKVDLVLLGHSLIEEDMEAALAIAAQVIPAVPVLRLIIFPWLTAINNEKVLDITKGPYQLIDTVRAIVSIREAGRP